MVDKKKIEDAIKQALEATQKRKFVQSVDLVVNLKAIDLSKDKIDELVTLPHGASKPAQVCAFVGSELKSQSESLCNVTIPDSEFDQWTDKAKSKKLAKQCDFFIAQANVMAEVAKQFGKVLSIRGKMPSPKFGQVVPPKANLKPLIEKLKNSIMIRTKKAPVIQCSIGNEKMSEVELASNAAIVLDMLESKFPQGKGSIANALVKTTMGKPIKV